MISERLDNIIKAAINDNKLAEMKPTIYRRAQREGVSQDEVDKYIDSLMSGADKPKSTPSAKSGGFPKELGFLVKEYLTDGIIAAKERQVLLKKAQQMGVDKDEFDLYIDAQQQKADQVADAAAAKKRGKTCPFCGAPIPMFADKCPECEKPVTPEANKELQEILEKLEEALVDIKSGQDCDRANAIVERYIRKARLYYKNNPKVSVLLNEIEFEAEKANQAQNTFLKRNALVLTAIVGIVITAFVFYYFNSQLSGIVETHSGFFEKKTVYELKVQERDNWTGNCISLTILAIGCQICARSKRFRAIIDNFLRRMHEL